MTRRLLVGALGVAALVAAPQITAQPATHTVSQKHVPSISFAAEDAKTLLLERRVLHASRSMVRPAHKPAARVSPPKPKPKPVVHHTAPPQKIVHVPTGAVKAYALKLAGSLTQYGCVDSIFSRESGWRSTALNHSSGAFGIPQRVNPPPGWTDPFVQVAWGIHYMTSRYGSPCGAWAFWQGHGWY